MTCASPREYVIEVCWSALQHIVAPPAMVQDEDVRARPGLYMPPRECGELAEMLLSVQLDDVAATYQRALPPDIESQAEQDAGLWLLMQRDSTADWRDSINALGRVLADCAS